jgi:hypothetical protein
MIHLRRRLTLKSISGAQRNFRLHGSASIADKAVISPTSTPASRSFTGSAHHRNPIGAPSVK